MYNHYVVVLDWATEVDEGVQIWGIAHTLSDAEKIFNERVEEERKFAEDNGYSIEDDTNHVFSAGIMGYWRDNHTTLYIQGVNSYENSNSIA